MTEKYKFWDVQNRVWFTPSYPGQKKDAKGKTFNSKETKEILLSQSGEMFMHLRDNEDCSLTLLSSEDFIACPYSGVKDNNDRKAYLNDKIVTEQTRIGTVVINCGCFMIHWQDDLNIEAELLCLDRDGRRRSFEVIGNILEEQANESVHAG